MERPRINSNLEKTKEKEHDIKTNNKDVINFKKAETLTENTVKVLTNKETEERGGGQGW